MKHQTAGSAISQDERKQVLPIVRDRKRTRIQLKGARRRAKVELRKALLAVDDLDVDYEEDNFLDL